MSSTIGKLFGGLVAVILLALFSASTFYIAIKVYGLCSVPAATTPCMLPDGLIGEGFVYVLTTVSGLVSALVIAKLAVTEPGKPVTVFRFESGTAVTAATAVVVLYLLGWIATGLTALVFGVMLYPKANQTLADIGTTWLGLAVAAAYAYFGIAPAQRQGGTQTDADEIRAANDLTPGQKVPNASEAATSGPIVKKIKRTDPEFALLVSNQNSKIVFKDEEGTGADRMMTDKLKTRLDSLADLVAAEWPGVKLRVTEAWDEDEEHSSNALHYEGRAADLTTFPIDGAKLGRLGRLAVQAGCDWVFFEDSSHIHVSVKA